MNRSHFSPPFGVVMTCDITCIKVSGAPLGALLRAPWGHSPLYILFIFRCHIMSLRHHPLLEGLSCVTLDFPLLSHVTPYAGA